MRITLPLQAMIAGAFGVYQAATDRAAEAMEACVLSQAQGHAFTMEQGRIGMLEGKMGMRESIAHRVIQEAGGGQARAHLPGGMGGVPTVVPSNV